MHDTTAQQRKGREITITAVVPADADFTEDEMSEAFIDANHAGQRDAWHKDPELYYKKKLLEKAPAVAESIS